MLYVILVFGLCVYFTVKHTEQELVIIHTHMHKHIHTIHVSVIHLYENRRYVWLQNIHLFAEQSK